MTVTNRYVEVDGLRVFYREAGPADAPTLLLLHGFPSSSHQFRDLLTVLGDRYHLIAPDYPGFGYTDSPVSASAGGEFAYTFDHLADVLEGFVEALGLRRMFLYVFDFGAPVGFRLALRRPEWVAGIITQNGNAYVDGLNDVLSDLAAADPDRRRELARQRAGVFLTLAGTKSQYLGGVAEPERVSPDAWTVDQYFLDQPGRDEIMIDLFADYPSNVEQYPAWQEWLRTHRPPLLVAWGRHDPIFGEPGALPFGRDVPDAELHLLPTGHFALETHLTEIAGLIAAFVDRHSTDRPSIG
jgi:pimeloyl-ACP methyl ester carboxylesterase